MSSIASPNLSDDDELKKLEDVDTDEEYRKSDLDTIDSLPGKELSKLKRESTASLLSRKVSSISIAPLELDEPNGQEASVSSDADSSASSPGADWSEKQMASPELPQEYWQVQRLVKYIKVVAVQMHN